MDAPSLSNLLTPIGLCMIAIGVAVVSFLAIRNFSTVTRRRARLAGGAVAAGPAQDPRGVAEAFSGVVGLSIQPANIAWLALIFTRRRRPGKCSTSETCGRIRKYQRQ